MTSAATQRLLGFARNDTIATSTQPLQSTAEPLKVPQKPFTTDMKIKIDIQDIHETLEASDAASMLHRVKEEATSRAPFLIKMAIRSMSDLGFAAKAVEHHNAKAGTNDVAPASAQAFLDWAVLRGYVTILEA